MIRCKNCKEELVERDGRWLHNHSGDYGYWCWTTHAQPDVEDLFKETQKQEELAAMRKKIWDGKEWQMPNDIKEE